MSSDNPTERGDTENLAIILQDMVRKFDAQREELQALKAHLQEQERRQAEQEREREAEEDSPTTSMLSRPRRKIRRKSSVSSTCRDAVRKVYRTMEEGEGDFRGFRLTESLSSPDNQDIVKVLKDEVVKEHGGPNKCPFSSAELKEAARRYFKSKKDDRVRAQKGKFAAHRSVVRKSGRLIQKLERRLKAFQQAKGSWTERSKRQAEEALKKDFMSSESSDSESERPVFKVRRLAWESGKLRKLKDSLDEVVPAKGTPREVSEELSDRKLPEGAPKWAISKRYGRSTPDTEIGEDSQEDSSFVE
ncbi:hypothetical protein Bbelb_199370 [Branchiostoma belcheri]|nr:hypothetical protein Bbelb_199370 [Branchiostoma belcheri]